jgi:hypothetical protein
MFPPIDNKTMNRIERAIPDTMNRAVNNLTMISCRLSILPIPFLNMLKLYSICLHNVNTFRLTSSRLSDILNVTLAGLAIGIFHAIRAQLCIGCGQSPTAVELPIRPARVPDGAPLWDSAVNTKGPWQNETAEQGLKAPRGPSRHRVALLFARPSSGCAYYARTSSKHWGLPHQLRPGRRIPSVQRRNVPLGNRPNHPGTGRVRFVGGSPHHTAIGPGRTRARRDSALDPSVQLGGASR